MFFLKISLGIFNNNYDLKLIKYNLTSYNH